QSILAERHGILSALVMVLQRYLQLGQTGQEPPTDNTFTGHWEALCRLLYAYAEVMGRSQQWCDSIIKVWREQLSGEGEHEDANGSEIETLLEIVLEKSAPEYQMEGGVFDIMKPEPYTFEGHRGKLYTFKTWSQLLDKCALHNRLRITLPTDGEALGRRVRSDSRSFQRLRYLPTDTPGVEILKRKTSYGPFGFFVPDQ